MSLPELEDDFLYVVVFGPGFGESIVIRSPEPDARWIIVDSCRDQQEVPAAKLMKDHGARWHCAVLTHPHEDHATGFDEIVAGPGTGPIGCANPIVSNPDVVGSSPGWEVSSDDVERLWNGRRAATIRAISSRWDDEPATRWNIRRGNSKSIGPVEVTALHPDETRAREQTSDFNRISSPLLVEWKDVRILLGADLPGVEWNNLPRLYDSLQDHRLLKVPHHGSRQDISARYGDGVDDRAFWIVTPYNRGHKLPRFDRSGGINAVLDYVDEVHLTSLPESKERHKAEHQTLERAELLEKTSPVNSVGGIDIEPLNRDLPEQSYRCYVGVGFAADGAVQDKLFGHGSLTIH